jgi:hypothetical protein
MDDITVLTGTTVVELDEASFVEHIEPRLLSRLEQTVFRDMQPVTVVITTPNADFNPLLGISSGPSDTAITASSGVGRKSAPGRKEWRVETTMPFAVQTLDKYLGLRRPKSASAFRS